MELFVGDSLLLYLFSDCKEETILHLELVGSSENNPSVDLSLKKGRGTENI